MNNSIIGVVVVYLNLCIKAVCESRGNRETIILSFTKNSHFYFWQCFTGDDTSNHHLQISAIKIWLLDLKKLNQNMVSTHLSCGVFDAMITSLAFPCLNVFSVDLYPKVYLPLFMTRASLVLMLSIAFFCFFEATMMTV